MAVEQEAELPNQMRPTVCVSQQRRSSDKLCLGLWCLTRRRRSVAFRLFAEWLAELFFVYFQVSSSAFSDVAKFIS